MIEVEKGFLWVASFDIGYRNLCFSIEEYNVDEISHLHKIDKNKQYNDDGTATEKQSEILTSICKNSRTVIFKNTDLTKESIKVLNPEVFHLLTDLLDEYQEYWDKCGLFVIEKQMSFKGVYNVSALKLGQHCWSYFAFKCGRFKQILDFPAYHKTQIFGAPKTVTTTKAGKIKYKSMDKLKRKKWVVTKALEIFSDRNDTESSRQLQCSKKKDDISDCILQSISAVYLIFVEKSI